MRLLPLIAAAFFAAAPASLLAQPAPAAEAEAPGVIDGLVIARADGRFLGVKTEGPVLRVTFYDKKKKKETADAVRISVRWSDNKPRRTVLMPTTPDTLSSPAVMSRPFKYIVYLALVGPDDAVIESHSLSLAGSG